MTQGCTHPYYTHCDQGEVLTGPAAKLLCASHLCVCCGQHLCNHARLRPALGVNQAQVVRLHQQGAAQASQVGDLRPVEQARLLLTGRAGETQGQLQSRPRNVRLPPHAFKQTFAARGDQPAALLGVATGLQWLVAVSVPCAGRMQS